jgi:hypothetical protein
VHYDPTQILLFQVCGLEVRFASEDFQLPAQEGLFFNHIADVMNAELRKRYTPGPREIGF